MSGGFGGFNRGRNNRIAAFKEDLNLVQNNHLVSEDFSQFAYTNDNKIPGTNSSENSLPTGDTSVRTSLRCCLSTTYIWSQRSRRT